MRVLVAQINPIVGDIAGNTKKILCAIEEGKKKNAQLVLFSELALLGYPPEDFLLLPHFLKDAESALQTIILATQGIAVVVGVVRSNSLPGEKFLFNSAAILENGRLIGFQDKILLPTYDVFDERRFFEPGHNTKLWVLAGRKVAITICEDIWQHTPYVKYSTYLRDPISEIAPLQPDLLLNLSASPYSLGHFEKRLNTCKNAAKMVNAPLLLCNQVGGNDSLIFDGHSLYIDKNGNVIDCAASFVEDYFLVDLSSPAHPKKFISNSDEELHQALVLGLRDYFHKSGFTKACLGLSGGIDSALVASIAVTALGKENVLGILMPSRYSSQGSITDALLLAKNLGIKTHEISIEGPFKSYLELLTPYFNNHPADVTEENMQARIRGMILMAFSNKFGYIVLNTGNKSEMALGYSTLYGDMCGGLCVICDITKQQVYALSRWINRNKEIIPASTINKAPSAELHPNQKDADSLPDYAIVDAVLTAYIEEHLSPQLIAERFGYSLAIVEDLIARIHRNEYKRRQSPPGLRISTKAFSAGRRFPIVQRYIH